MPRVPLRSLSGWQQLTLLHFLRGKTSAVCRSLSPFNMNEINFAHLGLLPKKGMHTPWGAADSLVAKCPDKSVIVVSTCSHGGVGVHVPSHPIPEQFKAMCIIEGAWAWFEEDEDSAAAHLMFPDLFPKHQEGAEETLRNLYPAVYAAHYGRMPTAAESYRVRVNETRERLKNNYTVKEVWGDWAWNVPQGHLYVCGCRESDGHEAGFLIPNDDYKSPINEIVLDAYPLWEPDRSLPYTKPRQGNVVQPALEV